MEYHEGNRGRGSDVEWYGGAYVAKLMLVGTHLHTIPYYPDDAERADAELYARNVRTLMLARLGQRTGLAI